MINWPKLAPRTKFYKCQNMIKDRNDIGTRPPLHSTNQTWNCQFMKNWRYHRTNGQNWKKDPKFHRHKRWTRLQHPRTLDHGGHGGSIVYLPISPASPPRVSVSSFYPALVSHSCVGLGLSVSVSWCLSRGDTLRAACAVKNIISYSLMLQVANWN